MHNEVFHNLYVYQSNQLREGEHTAAHIGEMRNSFKSGTRKTVGKRQFGRAKCQWEDNIEINHKGCEL